jgi:hypothetical protein
MLEWFATKYVRAQYIVAEGGSPRFGSPVPWTSYLALAGPQRQSGPRPLLPKWQRFSA